MRCMTVHQEGPDDGLEIGLTNRDRLAVVLASDDPVHSRYAQLDETKTPQITELPDGRSIIHHAQLLKRKIQDVFPVLRQPSPLEIDAHDLLIRVNTRGKHRTGRNGNIQVGGGAHVELVATGHSGRKSAESLWEDGLITLPKWGYALIRIQGGNEQFAIAHHDIRGLQIYTRNDYARILHAHNHHGNHVENGMRILLTDDELSDYWHEQWDRGEDLPTAGSIVRPTPHFRNIDYERADTLRKPTLTKEVPPYFPGFNEESR